MDLSLWSGLRKTGVSTMTKSQGRYSDSDLGRAIRFLLKGRSISYVSIFLDRREDNIRKKFLEVRNAIDDALSGDEVPTHTTILFDDNFEVDNFLDDSLDINLPNVDARSKGRKFKKQPVEYIQDYLTKKKITYQVLPEDSRVLIYKSRDLSDPKQSYYSYYYETGEWTAPTGEPNKVYKSWDIENFVLKYYKSAEDDRKYWEEKEAEKLWAEHKAEKLEQQQVPVDQNVTKIDLTESDMNFLQKLFSKKKAQYE